jgi:hypothetical protein
MRFSLVTSIKIIILVVLMFPLFNSIGQTQSIPRTWVKQLLFSIRNDLARPPVHARNLYQLSVVMHDAWAAIEPGVDTYFLGKTLHGFESEFSAFPFVNDSVTRINYQNEAISFAAFRLIKHRFANAPGAFFIYESVDSVMIANGYDINFTSTNYLTDGPAALGNYIAQEMISYGLQDGSNEAGSFQYQYYEPANDPIEVELPGNPTMVDPSRWQPISLSNPIDQAGNPLPSTPLHLGPEWGNVHPFALTANDVTVEERDGNFYNVYYDPGVPPYLDTINPSELEDFFKWNFVLVSIWQSHLDPDDNTIWDISPNNIGNITDYPENWGDYENFYDLYNGGDNGLGHTTNPITGLPYSPQLVKRGDYARVLAEFWADGLDSETPPGHWFEIYNTVSNHPLFEKKWKGQGPELSDLEYDIKAYLTLGGGMHDAAITAWSMKGWYDYPRPVSMIRYMADKGQSSDPLLPNFHPAGLPLIPGFVEIVEIGDPLAGAVNENVNKIKLYTWRGPDYISDPEEDIAGVGWILAENWWPYQRPSFVSPPFSGYVSGHSTFSSVAAVTLSFMTGSPYFPGGIGEFIAPSNEYLEFEEGPSETIILQWATYKDAADQCSLSRLWGGIHPPIDDIPGRKIGEIVGNESTSLADEILGAIKPSVIDLTSSIQIINENHFGQQFTLTVVYDSIMDVSQEPLISFPVSDPSLGGISLINQNWSSNSTYEATYEVVGTELDFGKIHVAIENAISESGTEQKNSIYDSVFVFDTQKPELVNASINYTLINNQHNNDELIIDFYFSEDCNNSNPTINYNPINNANYIFTPTLSSEWISPNHFQAIWHIELLDPTTTTITISLEDVYDVAGNQINPISNTISTTIDTELPEITLANFNQSSYNETFIGSNTILLNLEFSKPMDQNNLPSIVIEDNGVIVNPAILNLMNSQWLSAFNLSLSFDLFVNQEFDNLDFIVEELSDLSGNIVYNLVIPTGIQVDTRKPEVSTVLPSTSLVDLDNYLLQDFDILITYDENMDLTSPPLITPQKDGVDYLVISYNPFSSEWISNNTYRGAFTLPNAVVADDNITFKVELAKDLLGNVQPIFYSTVGIDIEYDPSTVSNSVINDSFGEINVFPNPIHSSKVLNIESTHIINTLSLIDPSGREIFFRSVSQKNIHLPLSEFNLATGLYILTVQNELGKKTLKLVIHD